MLPYKVNGGQKKIWIRSKRNEACLHVCVLFILPLWYTLFRNALHALQMVPCQVDGGNSDSLGNILFITDGVICHYLRRAKYDHIAMHFNNIDARLLILQVLIKWGWIFKGKTGVGKAIV